jgi:cytochrome c-type biogenesis protein CcmE
MHPRTKWLIGGAIILGSAGLLMANAITKTGEYYLTPQELATKISHDPSFVETGVKVGARVVPGSIVRAPGGREVSFRDTFTDGVDVVVEGRLGQDGTFHATTLLAKCASRYENAPEKYRSTPGYRTPNAAT